MKKITRIQIANALFGTCLAFLLINSPVSAAESGNTVIVNVDNFVRVETAAQFDRTLEMAGSVNQFFICANRHRSTNRMSFA